MVLFSLMLVFSADVAAVLVLVAAGGLVRVVAAVSAVLQGGAVHGLCCLVVLRVVRGAAVAVACWW